MKVQARNIEAFVKSPPPAALAILIYGPDEGLVRERMSALTKTVVSDVNDPFNVAEFQGDALIDNPARLIDEAQAMSMLGGRRVVRVRAASDKAAGAVKDAVKALKNGDNLILVEAGELSPRSPLRLLFEGADNAAALPCYVDDERDISRILSETLRTSGYRISSDALAHLAENVTGDRAVARGEAEKLITYMGPMKDIALEDATACVGEATSLSLDDLARHTASGRFAEADRILTFILSEGTAPVAILRTLQNYFMRLHLTKARIQKGENTEQALAKLKPPLFFKHKSAFESQLMTLDSDRLEQALSALSAAEARCKQTGSMPETIVSRAVLSLCQMAARAASRRRA
jgi:DNA polymerase-3 subunit delta